MMNDSQMSLDAGYCRNYLYVLKSASRERYDLIKQMGGLKEFKSACINIRTRLGELYYRIDEDTEKWKKLYDALPEGYFANHYSLKKCIDGLAFTLGSETMGAKLFRKYTHILEVADELYARG